MRHRWGIGSWDRRIVGGLQRRPLETGILEVVGYYILYYLLTSSLHLQLYGRIDRIPSTGGLLEDLRSSPASHYGFDYCSSLGPVAYGPPAVESYDPTYVPLYNPTYSRHTLRLYYRLRTVNSCHAGCHPDLSPTYLGL